MEPSVLNGWAARGLGGVSNIIETLANDGSQMNVTHLQQIGESINQLLRSYAKLIDQSNCEPHDRRTLIAIATK